MAVMFKMSATSKASQRNTQKVEAVKIVFKDESGEPHNSKSKFGEKHLNVGKEHLEASLAGVKA